jgi:hypothetical protein
MIGQNIVIIFHVQSIILTTFRGLTVLFVQQDGTRHEDQHLGQDDE